MDVSFSFCLLRLNAIRANEGSGRHENLKSETSVNFNLVSAKLDEPNSSCQRGSGLFSVGDNPLSHFLRITKKACRQLFYYFSIYLSF